MKRKIKWLLGIPINPDLSESEKKILLKKCRNLKIFLAVIATILLYFAERKFFGWTELASIGGIVGVALAIFIGKTL